MLPDTNFLDQTLKKRIDKYYPFKAWALTLICGPFLGILFDSIRKPERFDITILIGGPLLMAIHGSIVSLPAFGLYVIIFRILAGRLKYVFLLKLILGLITIPVILITFYFLVNKEMLSPSNRDGFLMVVGHLVSGFLSGFAFRIYTVERDDKSISFEKV
jgi:hypothetical protein